jgi:hypothetical protein
MVSLVQHLLLGDGFTKTLTAEGLVQPGVNHIKLAIADTGDLEYSIPGHLSGVPPSEVWQCHKT